MLYFSAVAPVSAKVVTYNGIGNAGTIQDVINNASNGDSIFLAGGTYNGNIVIDRSLVFGALDSTNPPRIVTSGSGAGITLSADGITINGVTILGNASTGLSRYSRTTTGSALLRSRGITPRRAKSASDNVLSGDTIAGNSVGIDVDRMSRSNTFFFNDFNNTLDAVSQAEDNSWFSAGQEYLYHGKNYSGPLGNYWQGAGVTNNDGDGIGNAPYTLAPAGQNYPGAIAVTDPVPLISSLSAYTITTSAPFTNTTVAGKSAPAGDVHPPRTRAISNLQ